MGMYCTLVGELKSIGHSGRWEWLAYIHKERKTAPFSPYTAQPGMYQKAQLVVFAPFVEKARHVNSDFRIMLQSVGDVYIRRDVYIQVCIVHVIVIVYMLYSSSQGLDGFTCYRVRRHLILLNRARHRQLTRLTDSLSYVSELSNRDCSYRRCASMAGMPVIPSMVMTVAMIVVDGCDSW